MKRLSFTALIIGAFQAQLFAAPAVGTPNVTQTSIVAGVATTVTVTSVITDPSLITTSINLIRLNPGAASTVLGQLHDDGLNGDAVANDKTFSARITFNESKTGQIQLQVSAAFQGVLQRVLSGITSINVIAGSLVISGSKSPAANAAGWNKSTVTVTFVCSDGLSSITSCTAPVTVVNEGANQAITGTAKNAAGGSATTTVTVSLDTTKPTATGAVTPAPNVAGWNNSDATVTFSCSDSLSGTASCSSPVQVSTEGSQTVTGTAVDKADNSATVAVPLKLDKTAPFIQITTQDGALVYTSPASITGGVTDALSGVAAVTCNGTAAVLSGSNFTCSTPVVPGSNPVTVQARDVAGNTRAFSVTLVMQKVPPTIISLVSTPANGAGWNNSDVTVSFSCSDSTTSLNSCSSPVTVAADARNRVVTGTAINAAGTSASTSVVVNLDKTAPTINGSAAPAPNAAGWNKSDVTVTFNCADAFSGLSSCTPTATVSAEGSQTVIGTAIDVAGNTATAPITVNLDKTPPAVTISSPSPGAILFSGAAKLAGTVNDVLSGVASVSCNGIPAVVNGTNFTCDLALTTGSNSISVQATDRAGNTASPPARNVTVAPAPHITLTSPANLSFVNLTPITVRGTVDDPNATVTVNGLPAFPVSGSFSLSIPLSEGTNTLTAAAKNAAGNIATASAEVTLDTTPPHVTIDSPSDSSITTASTVTVTGTVNDIVLGTVNDQDAGVTVNGINAQVANRTYTAANIALAIGPNTIQAAARDRVGNGTTANVTITRVAPQPQPLAIGQAVIVDSLSIVSGNNQTGTISSPLAAPLTVQLRDAQSNPVANQPVVFKVTANNGMLNAGGPAAAAVVLNTDSTGLARANWTLGSRSGAGANTVKVETALAIAPLIFTATGVPSAASLVVVDSGNHQTGAAGQALTFPLVAVVTDAGFNRIPSIPVTFKVQTGGGSFGGATTQTVTTDSNGRALAVLTLGNQAGNDNHVVEANFPGNPGIPALFTASAKTAGNPTATTISGLVLDNSNTPIAGVTMRLFQTNQGNSNNLPSQIGTPVQTDSKGIFRMAQAPVGFFKLMADGGTAPGLKSYPTLEYDLVTIAGQDNTVGMPIYLPVLDTVNRLCVDATHGGTLTLLRSPGFALTVIPGSATFPGGSKTGCISVTTVNNDKVPMAPGFGQQPRFIISIQPAGTLFNPPAAISLPNLDGLAPRAITEMYSYDHDLAAFIAIGTGTVSADGSAIVSNPGGGVLKAGWHCGGNPNSTSTAATCPDCKTCTGTGCLDDPRKNGQPLPSDQCKVCSNGAGIDIPLGPPVSTSVDVDIPSDAIDQFNKSLAALKTLGITASINGVKLTAAYKTEDCCEATLGKGTKVTGSATGKFGGFKVNGRIYPPGPFPSFDGTINVFGLFTIKAKADFQGGIFIGVDAEVTGQVGYRQSMCSLDPAERSGCFFAQLGSSLTPYITAKVSGSAGLSVSCIGCPTFKASVSANLTAGQLSWPITVSNLSYNLPTCSTGVTGGVLQFGAASFKIFAGFSGSYTIQSGVVSTTNSINETFDFLSCTLTTSSASCS